MKILVSKKYDQGQRPTKLVRTCRGREGQRIRERGAIQGGNKRERGREIGMCGNENMEASEHRNIRKTNIDGKSTKEAGLQRK